MYYTHSYNQMAIVNKYSYNIYTYNHHIIMIIINIYQKLTYLPKSDLMLNQKLKFSARFKGKKIEYSITDIPFNFVPQLFFSTFRKFSTMHNANKQLETPGDHLNIKFHFFLIKKSKDSCKLDTDSYFSLRLNTYRMYNSSCYYYLAPSSY